MPGRQFHYYGEGDSCGPQLVGYDADTGEKVYTRAQPATYRDRHGVDVPVNGRPKDVARYNKYWQDIEDRERRAAARQADTESQSDESASIGNTSAVSSSVPGKKGAPSRRRKAIRWLTEPLPSTLPDAQPARKSKEANPDAKPGFFRRVTRHLTGGWDPLVMTESSKSSKGGEPYQGT
ncbi:hypothetical protein BU16DRAFT_559690 [Lophium mytilinum]|uniref:Uncharacterized protein n=1 Tax=Lophium mytilinum TaxID=390894 RepID=A0A6A6R0D9_9PEZI|nr:hypothetical protein BU16DRAFT_559690 [Lophium mytilinum]